MAQHLLWVWLLVSLAALVGMTRWFAVRLQRLAMLVTNDLQATLYIHFFLLLPGTVLHELSHWAMAKLLGVRTGRILLGPAAAGSQRVRFGGVEIGSSEPVRQSLIGLAPLISGTLAVLWVARARLGLALDSAQTLAKWPTVLRQVFSAQDAWLWIYLLLAISNAMLPSASDRAAWRILGLYLLVLLIVLYAAGALAAIPAGIIVWLAELARTLIFAFGLTALLDLAVGALLLGIEALLSVLLGRRLA
ncbi:MAG: hypothetical protein JXA74_02415 [Anaerolineae bacterium]|nr:hypothetical protein [Anaerolineae bacterium]